MSLRGPAALFAFAMCAHLTAQVSESDVVVVDVELRPGADVRSIVEGIAAVRAGGSVLVRESPIGYNDRVPIVIDKAVRIIGLKSGSRGNLGVVVAARIEIRDLRARDIVLIQGIKESRPGAMARTHDILLHDCAGRIIIHDCDFGASPFQGYRTSIERCASVHVRESFWWPGSDPILIEDSHVVFEQSSILSGVWAGPAGPPPNSTLRLGPGADVTLIRSEVQAPGSSLAGAQDALMMDGGVIRVDAQSAVVSEPNLGWLATGPLTGYPSPGSGTVWLDPGAFVQVGSTFVSPGITVLRAPVRVVDSTSPFVGGSYTAELRGAHGIDLFGAIVASPVVTQPFPNLHPTIGTGPDPDYATAWMDPSASTVIYLGPPVGQVTQSVGAAPAWSNLLLQGVFFGADNAIRLTPPFVRTVRDPDPAFSW